MLIDKSAPPLDPRAIVFGEASDGFYIILNVKQQDFAIATLFKIKRFLSEKWTYTKDKELTAKYPNPWNEHEVKLRLGEIGLSLAAHTIDEYLKKSPLVRSFLSIDAKEAFVNNIGQDIRRLAKSDDKTPSHEQLEMRSQLSKIGLIFKNDNDACHFVRKVRNFLNQLREEKKLKESEIIFEKNKLIPETIEALATIERMGYGKLFFIAARKNDVGTATLILQHVPEIHETHLIDNLGELTYLEMAMHHSRDQIIKSVLDADFDIDASFTGIGPLINEEIKKGDKANLSKIKSFLVHGAKLDIKYENHHMPLTVAVLEGNPTILKGLIDFTFEISKERLQEKLLFLAILHGHVNVINFLLTSMAADINAVDENGDTVLHVTKNEEILALLISRKANVNTKNKKGVTPLWQAVDEKDLARVIQFIKADADVNTTNPDGLSPLHISILFSPQISCYLINNGANVNAKDLEGRTPLHYAVLAKHFDGIKQLIEAKADVNAQSKEHFTPLYFAHDSLELTTYLLKVGAQVNMSRDALQPAVAEGPVSVIKTLLNAGASIKCSVPLLPLAGGDLEKIKLLLEHGADVNERTPTGSTAFIEMCKPGLSPLAMQFLISAGADVFARSEGGETPLFSVLLQWELVEILLKAGADINAQNNIGTTPLMVVAKNRHNHHVYTPLAQRLINAGAIRCMKDKTGQSAYHHAVNARNYVIARLVMSQQKEKLR